jgi:hypothetical protein
MMTFKQFYLQSSKGGKALPRALRSFKTHKMRDNRIAKLKAAKRRLGVGS